MRSVTCAFVSLWCAAAGIACGDDPVVVSDVVTTDASDATAADVAPADSVATACEATLTEVDAGFVEIVAHGTCDGWVVEVRDAAAADCAAYGSFLVVEGRSTGQIEVPPAAVIVIRMPSGLAAHTWTIGTCVPEQACLAFASEPEGCLPSDTDGGSVSLCGARWLADRAATPQAPNDCECRFDCAAAAGACQLGACVDGACRFEDKADGTTCDDHSLCTSDDACVAGACEGTLKDCGAPPGPCAKGGVCVPQTGQCIFNDTCGEHASCTASGCACAPGFAGDGITCGDIDECADDPCAPGQTCRNFVGTYQCVCPPGTAGASCTAVTCDCPWEPAASCGEAVSSLTIRVTDLWGQPLDDAEVLLQDGAANLLGYSFEGDAELPLCAPFSGDVTADAPLHHGFRGSVRWVDGALEVSAAPGADTAWALTNDGGGVILWIGLAHDWFASSGRPARRGNHLTLLMDGEEAWRSVRQGLVGAQSLITGSSWWWTSELEIVRDRATDKNLSQNERWLNTIMGTLEQKTAVDRKILVNQFISQDGLFSGITVDDALTSKGASASDGFDYIGQANPSSGEFDVSYPELDYGARVANMNVGSGTLLDDAPALPFHTPIHVDMTAIPFGLSYFDLPLASWHQKFWTIDQRLAFIGGMNAKTDDWDTNEHRVFEPLRMDFDADRAAREAVERQEAEPDLGPRKDYMVRIEGPLVADAVDVFHRRWEVMRTSDAEYAENAHAFSEAPAPAAFSDGIQAQVVATMPAPFDEHAILETLLRAVENAQDFIYIEDQYFRAPLLYDAIVARMAAAPHLILLVATNEVSEWTDPGCWQTALQYERFRQLYPSRFRIYSIQSYDVVRTDCTFCFDETEAHFVPMLVHSKMVIIDDEFMEVGSCNSNNRGLLYEGELAVAVHDAAFVSAARERIFANVLGPGQAGDMPPSAMFQAFDAVAGKNATAYARWDDEGMDLDLDGDPIPSGWTPSGFVYPLVMDAPDECLIEDVGADVT